MMWFFWFVRKLLHLTFFPSFQGTRIETSRSRSLVKGSSPDKRWKTEANPRSYKAVCKEVRIPSSFQLVLSVDDLDLSRPVPLVTIGLPVYFPKVFCMFNNWFLFFFFVALLSPEEQAGLPEALQEVGIDKIWHLQIILQSAMSIFISQLNWFPLWFDL